MDRTYGQVISGMAADGTRAPVGRLQREPGPRRRRPDDGPRSGGLQLAYFDKHYVPLQVVSTFFFVEFLARLTLGLRYSPVGVVARLMTQRQPPDWVSAKPKRFAWTLGLGMAFSMMIITNSGIRGMLPRTICLICLTLMWMESVLGLCLGCKIHALLVRRGWATKDEDFEICANGECEIPAPAASATEYARS